MSCGAIKAGSSNNQANLIKKIREKKIRQKKISNKTTAAAK